MFDETYRSEQKQVKALRGNSSKSVETLKSEEYHTEVYASLVPDEVIYRVAETSIRALEGVVILGDISGFTDLCDKYSKEGTGGSSKLTAVINNYIGSIVHEILNAKGDIFKFSGDAFLATWRVRPGITMADVIHQALDTCLLIQNRYGSYKTEIGVVLRLKLGVSAGSSYFSIIGSAEMKHYMLVGDIILDVKTAEYLCSSGEIIVSKSVWESAHDNYFLYETLRDNNNYMKVTGIGPAWNSEHQDRIQELDLMESGIEVLERFKKHKYLSAIAIDFSDSDSSSELSISTSSLMEDEIRPMIREAVKKKMKMRLQPFIFPPIVRGLEIREPLKYLTEMRQVVIMFVNVTIDKLTVEKVIKLADNVYQTVCKYVTDYHGCVNKMNMFDKGIMSLSVFGLTGFKRHLESQAGLLCATAVYTKLHDFPGIDTLSIGVTTGVAYCGVIGHKVRQEYTVMGLAVNRAARLMVAFPSQVTCDRETFVHSKLQTQFFTLQQPKDLKGLTDVGPIYKFNIDISVSSEDGALPPLLGRNEEMLEFHKCLTDVVESERVDSTICNMLVIKGDAREGKTFLLRKMIEEARKKFTAHFIALSQMSWMIPYHLTQAIFSEVTGTPISASPKERRHIIAMKLKRFKSEEYLCSLNHIFNVDFEMTSIYSHLPRVKQEEIGRKMTRRLLRVCIPNVIVFGIDDAELMDNNSWNILTLILELRQLLLVMTIGTRRELDTTTLDILERKHVKHVKLSSLDKWDQVSFACRVLNVVAIPAELERILHKRSEGNPGWIETYLLTLIQSNSLLIVECPTIDIPKLGLVTVQSAAPLTVKGKGMEFKFFDMTYKQISDLKESALVKVCVVAEGKTLKDEDEITMNAILMQIFDSLLPFEKLLLKISSILGEIFHREMLLGITRKHKAREVAKAIKKLFDVSILCCAEADYYTDKHTGEHVTDVSYLNHIPFCNCKGITIPENCKDLPLYAFCQHMRFQCPQYCQAVYNMLTNDQRKEFHGRAVTFIERNTRRCAACGGGYFEQLSGFRREGIYRRRDSDDDLITRDEAHSHIGFEEGSVSRYTTFIPRNRILFGTIPIPRSMARKSVESLSNDFSDIEFSECQCTYILSTMYIQLTRHCNGAGLKDKVIEVTLEFADSCIMSRNVPQAMQLLNNAQKLLDEVVNSDDEQEISDIPKWKYSYIQANISMLIGSAHIEVQELNCAKRELEKALHNFGYTLPKLSVKMATCYQLMKLKMKIHFGLKGGVKGFESVVAEDTSFCLSLMSQLFREMGDWMTAKLCAIWSLNYALKSDVNFYCLMTAYKQALDVLFYYCDVYNSWWIENMALEECSEDIVNIEIHELYSVVLVYQSIFFTRILRGELLRSNAIGRKVITISKTLNSTDLQLQMLPLLIQNLILANIIEHAVTLLHELYTLSSVESDFTAKTWFHALCIFFHLQTGYSVITQDMCEQFYKTSKMMLDVKDQIAKEYFYVNMWLWFIRNKDFENAEKWAPQETIDPSLAKTSTQYVPLLSIVILRIEAVLIETVHMIDTQQVESVSQNFDHLSYLMKLARKAVQTVRVLMPRYKILKAYYKKLKHGSSVIKKLQDAQRQAMKQENILDAKLAQHTIKVWQDPSIDKDKWTEHSLPGTQINWHDADEHGYDPILYSYPLPTII